MPAVDAGLGAEKARALVKYSSGTRVRVAGRPGSLK
jgi:hypothetical protein